MYTKDVGVRVGLQQAIPTSGTKSPYGGFLYEKYTIAICTKVTYANAEWTSRYVTLGHILYYIDYHRVHHAPEGASCALLGIDRETSGE